MCRRPCLSLFVATPLPLVVSSSTAEVNRYPYIRTLSLFLRSSTNFFVSHARPNTEKLSTPPTRSHHLVSLPSYTVCTSSEEDFQGRCRFLRTQQQLRTREFQPRPRREPPPAPQRRSALEEKRTGEPRRRSVVSPSRAGRSWRRAALGENRHRECSYFLVTTALFSCN